MCMFFFPFSDCVVCIFFGYDCYFSTSPSEIPGEGALLPLRQIDDTSNLITANLQEVSRELTTNCLVKRKLMTEAIILKW